MSFFISDAFAAAGAPAAAQTDGTFSLIMIVAIFVLFYFMLIRPQNKRAKEHKALINQLKKGDEIVTNAGILGKVVSLDDQYIKVSLAEGVEISMQRGAVTTVLPKGTLKSL
ncbi:preprotein translocase subunit YajC [Legionella fallonii]|uniref:Sec translocon accessory complex subunit YajC n=1 Tax=Legionella fallonii LLAP-10 TaxID=1212491 RepID=A0A098G524_9GAMM|nr:preprotein translocase subunit YajC [Legionella fallonii]CEG57572.1 SecYEG protein translocase auxillary subunit [Legionella fallonii LLAP-10]